MSGIYLGQYLKLEQKLTPQQILLSTLLQLPMLSLEQRIKSELEQNPVLEEGEDDPDSLEETIEANDDEIEQVEEELKLHEQEKNKDEFDKEEIKEAQDDTDIENLFKDEDTFEIKIPKDKNTEEFERPEVSQSSLHQHLLDQFHTLSLPELEYSIGEHLIWNIRDDGYLDTNLDFIQLTEDFEIDIDVVEKVLKHIQHLEPVGIGARNLRECLLAQLEEQLLPDPMAISIIKDNFEDFKNRRFDKLMQILDADKERLQEAIDEIKQLNPKPGRELFETQTNYITPDFAVEKVEGQFVVSLNDWNIPPLRISNTYKNMLLDKKNTDTETRSYIRKKVENARWFITSIYQRKMTMMKVMEAIVSKQIQFFEKGPDFIEPLIMREIAEIIKMDISTVSRVSNGKYVQTDYGVFELKYFFNERIENEDGEEIATPRIKKRIQEIVDKEDSKKPFSDDKLSAMLKTEGFPIARRTVAKYREQLGIPVARMRKGM
ncbi:MAG: RNA polymerase sigma-54 factor [Calditrichaeota bacterium]|nr:MAG: RNA polymerase sigma-54 factor [Calditrichota bacterium]MBL1207317.1 RNA polymerase sigma-54 factor [Calditrichota bacterium]NOG47149.1 RNA polymerase factor sigma-54 [Calditrichota bacterium]